MAKWLPLSPDRLFSQPDQQRFLADRRLRFCRQCRLRFTVEVYATPPVYACPGCQGRGVRVYDRMTIIAGRRFGKTKFGSIAMLEELCIPNTIAWACAPTNPKLHRYILPAFQQIIPEDWVLNWDGELLDLRLTNGSLLHLQTLDEPDQGRGQGIDVLWIDEVAELTLKHWEVISPSLGDRRGLAFFTTSPRGYDWTWDTFYRPAEEGTQGYWALKAKTSQNPKFQDEDGRAFLERERTRLSPAMYRQEYEADFVTFTGAIYGEHIHQSHVLRSEDQIRRLVPSWPDLSAYPSIVGIDTGADHPFGASKIISTEHGLICVGDYLERSKSFIEHASALKRLAFSNGTTMVKWAINKNEKQPMIELVQHGITCQPAQNDQVAGIERVKSWLFNNQLYFYEPLCRRTVQQMTAYRWDENYSPKDGQARKEKVYKVNDELPDCVRYALMTWPALPVPIIEVKPRDISNHSEEAQAAIHRMRRIEKELKDSDSELAEDFWL